VGVHDDCANKRAICIRTRRLSHCFADTAHKRRPLNFVLISLCRCPFLKVTFLCTEQFLSFSQKSSSEIEKFTRKKRGTGWKKNRQKETKLMTFKRAIAQRWVVYDYFSF
jgi:hypothetical protein